VSSECDSACARAPWVHAFKTLGMHVAGKFHQSWLITQSAIKCNQCANAIVSCGREEFTSRISQAGEVNHKWKGHPSRSQASDFPSMNR
jgi:hypothetical protein